VHPPGGFYICPETFSDFLENRESNDTVSDRAEFVAVQPGRVRVVVQAGAPDVSGRRMVKQVFFHRVPVPGTGDWLPRSRRIGTTPGGVKAPATLRQINDAVTVAVAVAVQNKAN
jgi:hypothetical protein